MELSAKDRLMLVVIMPQKGGFVLMETAAEAKRLLGLTAEEREHLEMEDRPDGSVRWNPEKEAAVDVKLPSPIRAMFCNKLRQLDSSGELTADHLDIYRKFMVGACQDDDDD